MAASSQKPNVIIFGGLNTSSRALAALLVPVEGDPLVTHLRIVDKYSVEPPTAYIGSEFPEVLKKSEVEYRQANLTVPATVAASFDPPEQQGPYDYVFDYTGEIRHDRAEMIVINNTFNIARLLGLEAARRNVKAFVRLQQPFYETPEKGSHDEKEDIKPLGTLGTWHHETLRMLGAIENLNLVILRTGFAYGPYTDWGIISSVIVVGAVYGYLKKPMKTIWPPGKHPVNTVHVNDVAGALWACAEWMAREGRKSADTVAGEYIVFRNDKSKVKEVAGMVAEDQKVIAPLFNLTDDSNSTLLSTGQIVTSFFGTTFEFYNMIMNTMAKFRLDEVVEEINEHHVSGWTDMITTSTPPIPNTPLSAYMDSDSLSRHVVAFNNAKLKKIVGYILKKPTFDHDAIKEIVDKWKTEGSWPNLP